MTEQIMKIGFNKPYMTGRELEYLNSAYATGKLSGNGVFTKQCQRWLEQRLGVQKALLTQSCTAALEMAALLVDIQPGDEVIMPSYTFVSTANAFVLRGAIPVFVDIRPDTLNIDESKIEAAITDKTKAIVPVHYAGVSCEMDTIMAIAKRHHLYVIEDAAQGILSEYKGRPLGSIGHLAAFSFHETKNIISGEGGALLINDERFIDRAEIIWEKGTNRSKFFRGQVDKYTWVDVGSSFLPSELTAAFLWAQLEEADKITELRMQIWQKYHAKLAYFEEKRLLSRPVVPEGLAHNGHLYFILLPSVDERNKMLDEFRQCGINAVFHYIPLHSSPAGAAYTKKSGSLNVTESIAERIIRLPLHYDISDDDISYIMSSIAGQLDVMEIAASI